VVESNEVRLQVSGHHQSPNNRNEEFSRQSGYIEQPDQTSQYELQRIYIPKKQQQENDYNNYDQNQGYSHSPEKQQ